MLRRGFITVASDGIIGAMIPKSILAEEKSKEMRWILSKPENAYRYAYDGIKGPFLDGEPIIATDAFYVCGYACDVIKGRFEAGEDIIATCSGNSCDYAIGALKGRFIKGEPAIAKNRDHADEYNEIFGTNL